VAHAATRSSASAHLRGTLWLDRRASRLIDLEYQYADVGRIVASRAGGRFHFAPLTGGGCVITAWRIAMPVLALSSMPRTVQRTGGLLMDAPPCGVLVIWTRRTP